MTGPRARSKAGEGRTSAAAQDRRGAAGSSPLTRGTTALPRDRKAGAGSQDPAGRPATEPVRPGTSAIHAARQMLARAHWAAGAFASYDRPSVLRISEAVARAAHAQARRYAEWAVKETGFGVAEHKALKNEACSLGLFQRYRNEDYVSPRTDPAAKILSVPRPAGVILALTPSTNPVCTVFFKVILALLTRNAIVVSPHPMARDCCTDAARLLATAATDAGAPDGAIQVLEEPTVELVQALMADPVTDVIVATGGAAMVRAAYRSGNPALGVGPGNVPVLVDTTADLAAAAARIAESKAFDNSLLCTNESVLIAAEPIAGRLTRELARQRAAVLEEDATARLRAYLFPDGMFNGEAIGQDATWIAKQAGIRVPPRTKVLITPFGLVLPEEPLAREKLCPVLGMVRAPDAEAGIAAARAVVRIGGTGHSAAIHSSDPAVIMRFAARVPVLRVAVNAGNSTGSAGLDTNLAPSMTLGTGFAGGSSIGENLEPRHLVNWVRVAYNAANDVPFGDFTGLSPWGVPAGPVPPYPVASNLPAPDGGTRSAAQPARLGGAAQPAADRMREQLRALIIEELRQLGKV